MSRRIRNIVFAAIGSTAVALSAGTFALANIPTDEAAVEDSIINDDADMAVIAPPVSGADLFADAAATKAGRCMTGADVVAELDRDRAALGGQTVMLADGLPQDFADSWRRQAGVAPVKVSGVLAHIFSDADGAVTADVVEFDPSGCALSRTMITGDDWNRILGDAAGEEV